MLGRLECQQDPAWIPPSLPASAAEERQSQQDEAMGLKLSLLVPKVRRSLTLAGRKLGDRKDGDIMVSEMCGCCLPRIICPNVILFMAPSCHWQPLCLREVRAAVIRHIGSQEECGSAVRAGEVKHEEWGGKQKMVGALWAVICILLIVWAGGEQTLCTQMVSSKHPSFPCDLQLQVSVSSMKTNSFSADLGPDGTALCGSEERGFPAVGLAASEGTAGRFIVVPQPPDHLNLCEDSLRKPSPSQPHLADAQFHCPGKRMSVGPAPWR